MLVSSSLLEFFSKQLAPDRHKQLMNYYKGRRVIWFGTPGKMVVVNKDNVHGMWGNIYDNKKLEYVQELIEDADDRVEFECSYGHLDVVDMQQIREHQEAEINDVFNVDYDGHESPYSTGDDELDRYLGMGVIEFLEDWNGYSANNDEVMQFCEEHHMELFDKSEAEIRAEFAQLEDTEEDEDLFELFIDMEHKVVQAEKEGWGDIGKPMVQLRDGHHRVFGAIAAGEEWVCVDIVEKDINTFKDVIKKSEDIHMVTLSNR